MVDNIPTGPPYTPDEEVPEPDPYKVERLCVNCQHHDTRDGGEPCESCQAARNRNNPDDWSRPNWEQAESMDDVEVD